MESDVHDIFKLHSMVSHYEEPQTSPAEKKDLVSEFDAERLKWRDMVVSMSNKYRDIRKITEVQVEAISARQNAVEKKHSYTSLYHEANTTYKKQAGAKVAFYTAQSSRKYTNGQIDAQVDGDLSELKRHLDLLSQHINFFDETIRSIDHIIYAIKDRIAYERFIKGDL